MTAAATGMKAIGSVKEGRANAKAMMFNAAVQERNALRSDEQAKDAITRGVKDEQRLRAEGEKIIGSQEAAYGAGAIDTSYGSPMDAILATTRNIDQDALTIRGNAKSEAEDFKFQAYNQRSGASLDRMGAKNAQRAGLYSAAGQVLTGGAEIYKYRAGQ